MKIFWEWYTVVIKVVKLGKITVTFFLFFAWMLDSLNQVLCVKFFNLRSDVATNPSLFFS